MKKVLIITYYWPPSGGAGVQRWLKFCKYLPEFGVSPTVITVHPDYASYPVTDASFENEIRSELKVVRTKSTEPLQWFSKLVGSKKVPYSGFSNVETSGFFSKMSRWIRGNLFIPDARKYWNGYAFQAAVGEIQNSDFDCVITTGPPHSTHLVGKKLKDKFGVKWVADFRDPWTDIYYYSQFFHTRWAKKKDARMEVTVLREADQVLSVCPSNFEILATKEVGLRNKMTLIPNGFDSADFVGISQKTEGPEFVIAYMGTMAATYNLQPIIKMLAKLDFNWKLVVAGVISPDIMQAFRQNNLDDNLDLKGYLPHNEALNMISTADVLLHVVPDVVGARMGTTGKLFEYIGSQIPILNFGHQNGDSAKFIEQADAGQTFDRTDAEGALNYLNQLQSGKVQSESNSERFNRRTISQTLAKALFPESRQV